MGMAPGAETWFWSIRQNGTVEIDHILQWAYAIANTTNPPTVNSLSYGMSANNVDHYLGKGYLLRSDKEFMKLAMMGLTVIIADGDTGAGDLGQPPMSNLHCETFHPDWPSQSPYITAVGSTYMTPYAKPACYLPVSQGGVDCSQQPVGEVSVSLKNGMFWTTGGGFANTQNRAPYQEGVVQTWLDRHNVGPGRVPNSVFNAQGRAYPDVVVVGHNLMVVQAGQLGPIDGTSASAPIFAGIVTLLNDERLRAGKGPLGFLNPFLYMTHAKRPEAFNDVTVGRNGCGSYGFAPMCCEWDYAAAPGWDPVSGLGSPNYRILLEEALHI